MLSILLQIILAIPFLVVVTLIHYGRYDRIHGLQFGNEDTKLYLRLKWDRRGFGYFASFDTGKRMHNRMHNL